MKKLSKGKFEIYMDALDRLNRWNFHPRLIDQNVSQHSFRCALMYIHFYHTFVNITLLNLADILLHDFEESVSGDIPTLLKDYMKAKNIDWHRLEREAIDEASISGICITKDDNSADIDIKFFDTLDAVLYAKNELMLGNIYFEKIYRECRDYLGTLIEKMAKKHLISEQALKDYLKKYYGVEQFGDERRVKSISHMNNWK